MHKVDMSAEAVTTRLKRVSQLRRLGLSLQKAKIKRRDKDKTEADKPRNDLSLKPDKRKSE
ncbi:MAG TPA: hypothetical protein DHU55_14050 [Blastocatellia bacterium]|jgi:hypothetical protein|nr:hypothetical protein [Blastocatellia bacterium]HAF24580.1 hypothetical protein [Blastocatellia bacterium]HCX30869.1 hypothetical protein [Blastocatellia bacterium]